VYEGKLLDGLIDLVRAGRIPRDATVLYVHQGGVPAIHGCSALFR
jgi:1-aminocyclopropane-1-carboxylate deaminase